MVIFSFNCEKVKLESKNSNEEFNKSIFSKLNAITQTSMIIYYLLCCYKDL